jgi:metallo-beta-lactamase family protein
MRITSVGAAEEVTGSCHFLEVGDTKALIDCGLFQGSNLVEEKNDDQFPIQPADLDYVFLTHGHLDHCGRLPLLVKRGFRGPIVTSAATADVAKFIMLDSAHVQHEDYIRQKRRRRRRGDQIKPPLYDEFDVMETLKLLYPINEIGQFKEYGKDLRVAFHDAGHILGSRFLEMEIQDGGKMTRVIFGGDIGNVGRQVMPDFTMPKPCDIVYCESTYGDRNHQGFDASLAEFEKAIIDSCEHGGNVIIPSFALERSQDILYALEEMQTHKKLPKNARVFLNSPLAINMTRLYQEYVDELGESVQARLARGDDPFEFPELDYVKTADESRALNDREAGSILIAGSGMCNGGRVVHHLKHNLWRREASVIFVGYQARNSLGRRIVDGYDQVKIYGQDIKVNANIFTIGGFSAHADQTSLIDWLDETGDASIRLVHGESRGLNGLKDKLEKKGRSATIVQAGKGY